MPDEDKAKVESAIEELKTAVEGESTDDIKAKTEALTEASMKLGELAYRKAQEEAAGEPDNTESGSSDDDDGTIDADFTDLEFEEDDEDEKSEDDSKDDEDETEDSDKEEKSA